MTLEIAEVRIPEAPGEPGWDDFAGGIRAANDSWVAAYGIPEFGYEPEEELPQYRNPYEPRRMLVARLDGAVIGRAMSQTHTGEASDTSWVSVDVHPSAEGRGAGRALADAIEEAVRGDGTAKIISYVGDRAEGDDRLPSPTGFGSVPATSRGTRFLQARGYRLEQVERVSRLALPLPGLAERLRAAEERSGPDYRVHRFDDRTPERWRADLGVLITAMSTDAPDGGVGTPEDVWTAERVAEADERRLRENPRRRVLVAIEHVPSGRLAAFTQLSAPQQQHRAVMQYGTLVHADHRGHGLGMLAKLANLAHLADAFPGRPSVLTFNAEENRPMLDVNEAMGFVSVAVEGAWRLDL